MLIDIVSSEIFLYSRSEPFSNPKKPWIFEMPDYVHFDFTTWSSKAELVGDVAAALEPELVKQFSGFSWQEPTSLISLLISKGSTKA